MLLDALSSLGLLVKTKEGHYLNNADTSRLLVKGGEGYFGDYLRVIYQQWPVWGHIGEILSTDAEIAAQQDLGGTRRPKFAALFQSAMSQVCDDNLREILALDIWSRARSVFDLGGGHGRHLITLLEGHPHLSGEIWDLPSAERMRRG
ncbi:MAG: hypothetical protein HC869_01180, partial [Rhodospirillales bacterium]|nr:hypothetical protein [Rhodospirillales bacterium]